MADGFKCANCGWEETPHDEILNEGLHGAGEIEEEGKQHIRGYQFSLINCPGFRLSQRDARTSRRIHTVSDFDMACLERRAQGRAAWGRCAAIQRQNNFERDLAAIPDREGKEAFIEKCRRNNHMMIVG